MDTKTGKIYDLSKEDMELHQKELEDYQKQLNKLPSGNKFTQQNYPKLVPITEEQMLFFKKQGLAFRSLWAKRIADGLTPEYVTQLKNLMSKQNET